MHFQGSTPKAPESLVGSQWLVLGSPKEVQNKLLIMGKRVCVFILSPKKEKPEEMYPSESLPEEDSAYSAPSPESPGVPCSVSFQQPTS